jgi:adenosylmethionine-8-amino-7-oxononanoate aminotransferase
MPTSYPAIGGTQDVFFPRAATDDIVTIVGGADPTRLARFGPDVDPGALVRRHGLGHGLLLYSRRQDAGRFGDWLLLAPPLVIDEAGTDDLLDRSARTLEAAEPQLLDRRD